MSIEKKKVIQLVVAIVGVFAGVFGLVIFNQNLLLRFPVGIRMVLMIVTYWLLLFVPGILMLANKEKLSDFGLEKEKIPQQILIGIGLALVMSLILTVIPILCGFRDMVGSTKNTQVWQFVYQFIYFTVAVALTEEFIFRGYIFKKLLEIKNSRWFAIIFSSVLFGLFHIFIGGMLQVLMTAIMGLIYCMFREKIKGCTLLSLIIAHGFYDALIVLWVAIL
jgi:membrane protease YdiL (CAAX protease family)